MGSDCRTWRCTCTFHLTGFRKFYGVADNPTEVIVGRMKEYIAKRGMPGGATLGSCTVLETAGEGALHDFLNLLDSALALPQEEIGRVVWVHLGVNSGISRFAVERRAVNEATFRCPDEMGWQPQRIPIVPEDGPLTHALQTKLPATYLVDTLVKKGFSVTASDDAGRFVCNYDYYNSLRHAAFHSTASIFVHVPPFSVIDEDTQMQFVVALLDVIADLEFF